MTPFATYALQFLNRQNIGLTTDSGGSHGAQDTVLVSLFLNTNLEDLNDPHLCLSHDACQETHALQDEDDDPYLQLDEDESARIIHDNRVFHPQSCWYVCSSLSYIACLAHAHSATYPSNEMWLVVNPWYWVWDGVLVLYATYYEYQ